MFRYRYYQFLRFFHLISFARLFKMASGYTTEYGTIAQSSYFDAKWYIKHAHDASAQKDPVQHFLDFGWKMGLNPSKLFDVKAYLRANPDIEQAQVNPLFHFERFGKNEGRINFEVDTLDVQFLACQSDFSGDEYSFSAPATDLKLKVGEQEFLPEPFKTEDQVKYDSVLRKEGSRLYLFHVPAKISRKISIVSSSGKVRVSVHNYNNLRRKFFIIRKNTIQKVSKFSYLLRYLSSFENPLSYKAACLKTIFAPKKYVLFYESLDNVNDNAYQLFANALKQNEDVYFVTSLKIYNLTRNKNIRKHFLIKDSDEYLKKFVRAKALVSSYYFFNLIDHKLSGAVFPFLNCARFFVPHGVSYDKDSFYLNYRNFGLPDAVYCCSEYEKDFFENKCGLKNVKVSGYPRMDKWFEPVVDQNKIMIFFTWRQKFGENFTNAVADFCQALAKRFPKKEIYYAVHSNISPQDTIIISHKLRTLVPDIQIIYTSDRTLFNNAFKNSYILITDYSSAAYDFMYSDHKIAIYYEPIALIEPQYTLLDVWKEAHLCQVAKSFNDVVKICQKPQGVKNTQKRERFFKYFDADNTARVLSDIQCMAGLKKSDGKKVVERSKFFDPKWYRAQYPEVQELGVCPAYHYAEIGWKQGYNPSLHFDGNAYLARYSDVSSAKMNPLVHYERHGKKEKKEVIRVFKRKKSSVLYRAFSHLVKNTKFSIIVASYNYAHYITQTLDSLLAQDYKNFEIIVVDDGSKDNSIEVIQKYCRKFSNVFLYTHPNNQNKGLPETLQLGLKKAKGDFICFCESDDYWRSDHLSKLNEMINSYPHVNIISNDVELFEDVTPEMQNHMKMIRSLLTCNANKIDVWGMKYNPIPTFSAVAVRADVLKKCDFNADLIPAWLDWWLWRQILVTEKLYYIPEKLTYFRIHNSFNSKDKLEKYNQKQSLFIEQNNQVIIKRLPAKLLYKMNKNKKSVRNTSYMKIKKSKYFDEAFYLKEYPDVCSYPGDAASHYLEIGWRLGYDPSPAFCTKKYLFRHIDVRRAAVNPLLHYEFSGKYEGRLIFPRKGRVLKFKAGHQIKDPKGKVLLVTHILNYTGAPMLLLNVAKVFRSMGYNVILLAPENGALKNEFLKAGASVYIDPNAYVEEQAWQRYKDESVTFCLFNTYLNHLIYRFFAPHIPSILWIHENISSKQLYDSFLEVLAESRDIYVPSLLTKSYLTAYAPHLKLLTYPIEDLVQKQFAPKKQKDVIRFAVIGAIQPRKGQDIALQAIEKLPASLRKRASFLFVGENMFPDFTSKLHRAAKQIPQICFKDTIEDRSLYYQLYNDIDVLLCPSREDPYPLVVIDALMHGCPVVISDHVGQKDLIKNGTNGYVFESENAQELAQVLQKILLSDALEKMSLAARKTYLKYFDYQSCAGNLQKIMEEKCQN